MKKKNETEIAIEATTETDVEAVEQDLKNVIDAVIACNPTLGIAITYTIDGEPVGSGVLGNYSPHQMLHAVDNLLANVIEKMNELDPEGTAAFIEEKKAAMQMRRMVAPILEAMGKKEN